MAQLIEMVRDVKKMHFLTGLLVKNAEVLKSQADGVFGCRDYIQMYVRVKIIEDASKCTMSGLIILTRLFKLRIQSSIHTQDKETLACLVTG